MTTRFDFIEEDKRIMEQKLRKHELPNPDYQKVLKTLPNDEAHGEELVVFEEMPELEIVPDLGHSK